MDYPKARSLVLSFLFIITVATSDSEINFRVDPLALLSATLRTYQKAACYSDQVVIGCPRGTSISIEFAQYNNFVAKDGFSIEELCPGSGKARPEIRSRTKHLLRGSIFGTPSLKIPSNRFMNVGYGLEIPVQSVAEDSSTTVTGSESVFGTTRSVDKVESTDYNSENALENCMWPNALQYSLLQTVVEACQKKKNCKFHGSLQFYGQGASGVGDSSGTSSYYSSTASSNAINSDPCPKRRKIVEVAYKCRPYEFRSKVACHNDVAQLECNPYSRIAVYSASFGRTEYESIQCPQPQGVREETCLASYATETVMKICHGRRRCNLAADANTFGSPCQPNSRMYLKVVYTCVPKQVLKDSKESEVEPDEAEDLDGDMNDLYDDELIYKESEAIPKLYSNTTTARRGNGTSSAGSGSSANVSSNQTIMNRSQVIDGDKSGVNPVMTHSADQSLEEDQERLYLYLIVLGSLGVLFSIIIFATKLVLQKRDLTTDAHLSSLAKGRDRAIEETIIQSGLNDTISEIDADIDIKTPLPLPSVFKNENYLTYAPASSLYAGLSPNQLPPVSCPGPGAELMPNSVLMAGRQSPDLIGVAQGPFVTTSVGSAGGQGPVAGILTSAIVIGTSAPSNSPISPMVPITSLDPYTSAPSISGGYIINPDSISVHQRQKSTPTPASLLTRSSPAHQPQPPLVNVSSQNNVSIPGQGTSTLRRAKPSILQPHLSYDGTAPRTLSTGVAVGSQFYYG
nr:uncharacterized protein LOC108005068 isoform X2 [Drosophila suzukii]XP_036677733.1 uncharacterized protein LOC108005068 isoform X2 [Drosophila suzukii]XP_036677734.1 uncharacterized protein LOC108005068 isoform X2 [Drosophila suzukii]XP_036677736.1 uncharacterized protein LOC108005068 isoform X2 [Drosophila suzukii]XP_036677737.1 uncharacterized protein LOC108005068 isoform X2 [Drosophila suzukii]XP_036677738.1 uncharacterized protein LOC108005068 isoform X2 [Drosophila suzukii]